MNPILVCGDPAADLSPATPGAGPDIGIGFCYVHGYQPIKAEGPRTPPEKIADPPPPPPKVVITCPHCGEEFEI